VSHLCTTKAVDILSTVSKNILPTDYQTAELQKVFQNTLYHVLIMTAYELAHIFPEHNVTQALKFACTHWRLPELYLGFGSGGRCVSVGTRYITDNANFKFEFGDQALAMDEKQRHTIAQIAYRNTPPNGSILVLGAGYRKDFKDIGLSPGIAVAKILQQGTLFNVYLNDPLWKPEELTKATGVPYGDLFRDYDTVLLATPHTEYNTLPLRNAFWHINQFVLDGPGTWSDLRKHFEFLRVNYHAVGEPGWLSI
jgi:UDP-N-acetyl-D-mannosaminuronate dehydrogenase